MKYLFFIQRVGSGWLHYWRTHPKFHFGVTAGVVFALFWLVCFKRLDPDFGWHLRTGDYILAHWLPQHDIYTYTAKSFRWINHEWGNDVLVAWLYKTGGYWSVATLYASIWTAALMVVARRARLSIVLLAALAIMPYVGSRPLGWTTLFFATLLATMGSKELRHRRWLPLLFILWANIHAGFIAGLAVIAYYAVRERRRQTVYLLLACAAATLVNAYGLRIYEEIFRTLFAPELHREVQEWLPFALHREAWLFVVLWGAGSVAFSKKNELISLSRLLFLAGLSATRNVPLFIVSALPELDSFITKAKAAIPRKVDRRRRVALNVFIGVILVTIYSLVTIATVKLLHSQREASYPTAAVAYLKQYPCEGNLFNAYNTGGYLIWKLPEQPVYIDGRMPTWQPYMSRYVAILQDSKHNYRQEFQRYNIRCALLGNRSQKQLIQALRQDGWRVVQQSSSFSLLKK